MTAAERNSQAQRAANARSRIRALAQLRVWVFDKDFFSTDKPLGQAKVSLHGLGFGQPLDVRVPLEGPRAAGSVHLRVWLDLMVVDAAGREVQPSAVLSDGGHPSAHGLVSASGPEAERTLLGLGIGARPSPGARPDASAGAHAAVPSATAPVLTARGSRRPLGAAANVEALVAVSGSGSGAGLARPNLDPVTGWSAASRGGVLWKKSARGGGWRRRFFRLHGDCLAYCRSETSQRELGHVWFAEVRRVLGLAVRSAQAHNMDIARLEKRGGGAELREGDNGAALVEKVAAPPYTFFLYSRIGIVQLCARDHSEMEEWIAAVELAVSLWENGMQPGMAMPPSAIAAADVARQAAAARESTPRGRDGRGLR